jgi:hypothetical protein
MKTLKITLHATSTSQLEYKCVIGAPDDADPDELIRLLHEAVDGGEFVEEGGFNGDWQPDGGEWSEANECTENVSPSWRYLSEDEGVEQVP